MYMFLRTVVNLHTSRCVRVIGKEESVRYLQLALHQGQIGKTANHSIVCSAVESPTLDSIQSLLWSHPRKWRCQITRH